MADLCPEQELSFKAKLQGAVQSLAADGIYLGVSSWKYRGWAGLIYDEQRYHYRGKFAEARFERDCLAEYAALFKTVCVDLGDDGPVFAGEAKKLASDVDVPTAFYRIMLDEENGAPRVLAFIAPQTMTGHEPLTQFLTSVREIEKQTELDCFPELPKEVQDRIETVRAERLW